MTRLLCVAMAWATALLLIGGPEAQAIKRKPGVKATDHPEAVHIWMRDSASKKAAQCSGALIAPNAVLTAAHCAYGFDTWEILAPYARPSPVRAPAHVGKVHPRYRDTPAEADMAVILLDKPV